MKNTVYTDNLIMKVIDNSIANDWLSAVLEWYVCDCQEDPSCTSKCICGKENIKYLYKIANISNKRILYPIGSSCIKKFGRDDLNKEVMLTEAKFKLLHAIENNEYLALSSEYFTRNLLLELYKNHMFESDYNNHNGEKDYEFILKMFNKKDKCSINKRQQSKINAIMKTLKSNLHKELAYKILR